MADAGVAPAITEVTLDGKTYPALADGEYDYIVLGTGLKECILAGMLAAAKHKKVLVVDRSGGYGGDCASLCLSDLYRRFNKGADPPEELFKVLGRDRDYNVDLIPKFIMAEGVLKEVLVKTRVHRSIQATAGFAGIGGCYVFSKSAGKGWFSSGGAGVEKVPATPGEAMSSSLLGMMQKTQLRSFLIYVDSCADAFSGPDSVNLTKITARQLYAKFFSKGDEDLPQFVGHGIALFANDDYLDQPASQLVAAIKMYRDSLGRVETSPFIYPVYGLSTLPEAFSRLCAVQGGVFILRTDVQEIVYEGGKAVGIVAKPDFADSPQAARATTIITDPTYLPEAKRPTASGHVIRSIMITTMPPRGVKTTSAQIIVPQAQVGRRHDIYVSMLSSQHMVCAKGKYVCIASTTQETKGTVDTEIKPVLDLFEPGTVLAKFDSDAVVYKAHDAVPTDAVFCTGSYDATTHFESVMDDVAQVWTLLTGEKLADFSVTDDDPAESGSGTSASASASSAAAAADDEES